MGNVWAFLLLHKLAVGLGVFWVASVCVTALPSPSNESNSFYKWLFAVTHFIIGALPRIFPALRVFDPTQSSATYFKKPDQPVNPPATGGN